MTVLHGEATVQAPAQRVWELLADFGAVTRWNPYVVRAHLLPGKREGVGAARHCDLEGGYLRERAIAWEAGRKVAIEVYESDAPLKRAVATFEVRPASGGGARVGITMDYEMKMGFLGALMDRLVARREFERRLQGMLGGLRRAAEGAHAAGAQDGPVAATA